MDEIDTIRAQNYQLLALLMGKAPTQELLEILKSIKGDASEMGLAYIALGQAANESSEEKIGREFFNLFVGVGRGEYLPYCSFYLTGFLHEKPLAKVREDMKRLGIERADMLYEPEDHIAILCEVMAELVMSDENEAKAFFNNHLKPWGARFFAEIEIGMNAKFYQAVGQFGRTFMEIEAEAYKLN
jgi:TorA maturation chaperone TorD